MNPDPPDLRPMDKDAWVLGLDPDTHHAGIALVRAKRCSVLAAATAPKKMPGLPASIVVAESALESFDWMQKRFVVGRIVIEGQRIYHGSKARPEDIAHLSFGAGALLQMARVVWPKAEWWIVEPPAWTGGIKKEVHQARTIARLTFDAECDKFMHGSMRSHCIDAAGLAHFGCDELNRFKGGVSGTELPRVLARERASAT